MKQIENWNTLKDKIHMNAVAHGFWEGHPNGLIQITNKPIKFYYENRTKTESNIDTV